MGDKTESRVYGIGMDKRPYDPSRCAEEVCSGGRALHWGQCSRKTWKEGWCKQHHPDAVAARKIDAEKRFAAKHAASPWGKLQEARETIEALRAELAALKRPMGENAPWSISELSGEIIMEGRGTLDPQDEVEIHNAAVRTIGALKAEHAMNLAGMDADAYNMGRDRAEIVRLTERVGVLTKALADLRGSVTISTDTGPGHYITCKPSSGDVTRADRALASEDKGQPT